MSEIKIVGRDFYTLVLGVCHANKQFQQIKQELFGILFVQMLGYSGDSTW